MLTETRVNELIEKIIANPEFVKTLTTEETIAVEAALRPYATSVNKNDNRILAFSYTNLREEYLTKFLTTTMVGFMYRRAKEFDLVPHETPDHPQNVIGREIISAFLSSMFEYDPDKHVRECGLPPSTEKEINLAKKIMAEYDGVFDIAKIKEAAGSVTVPNDTFAWLNMYKRDNFEQLRWATMVLYGVLPDLELMFQPIETFDDLDKYKLYENMHKDNLQFGMSAIQYGNWNLIGSFDQNKERVSFLNKNTEILQRMYEKHKEDERIGHELLKRRIKERKKENIKATGPNAEGLAEYVKEMETMPNVPTLSKEEKEELAKSAETKTTNEDLAKQAESTFNSNKKYHAKLDKVKVQAPKPTTTDEYQNDYNPPDDAVTVNVFKTSKDGMQKSHFFTEKVDPEKEEFLNQERVKEIKQRKDEETQRRIAAIKGKHGEPRLANTPPKNKSKK